MNRSGWSAPFARWVIESWAEHSRRIGGAKVAARLKRNIKRQLREWQAKQK